MNQQKDTYINTAENAVCHTYDALGICQKCGWQRKGGIAEKKSRKDALSPENQKRVDEVESHIRKELPELMEPLCICACHKKGIQNDCQLLEKNRHGS